jgi:hypothetical protein
MIYYLCLYNGFALHSGDDTLTDTSSKISLQFIISYLLYQIHSILSKLLVSLRAQYMSGPGMSAVFFFTFGGGAVTIFAFMPRLRENMFAGNRAVFSTANFYDC